MCVLYQAHDIALTALCIVMLEYIIDNVLEHFVVAVAALAEIYNLLNGQLLTQLLRPRMPEIFRIIAVTGLDAFSTKCVTTACC
jgi:hypothetical protein